MSRLPLRVRLVAGFVVAMLVLLGAAGAFVYWRVEYALDRGLDTELDQATAVITPLVDASGRVASPAAADATGAGWQVLGSNGQLLDSGGTAPTTSLVPAADLDEVGSGPITKDIGRLLPVADQPYRVQITALDPTGPYLVVGVRRDHRDEALRELLLQLSLAGLGALVVAAVVGDLLARAALRPVERYRRRAAEIAGGADGLRLDVPAGRDDEVTRLGHTLNDMLSALERSLEHERRFVNDASHELRTPLTLLTSRIQLARRRSRTTQEHEAVLDELAVDVARLTDLAGQLLELGAPDDARAEDTDVTQVVRDVLARRRLAQPGGADHPDVDLPSADARAAVDSHTLERILTNLVDNAYLHGSPPVQVRVRVVPGWTVIEVRDAGPGMPPALMTRATERFTRAAEARSRPGAGLGLSIVEQLARRAGGELRLCYQEHHSRHGPPTSVVRCDHSTSMTATVILPRPGLRAQSPG
ncbi:MULTISPECIES: sensor histidine kinase [unclassified Nocardioides]|uniref:sensor histidine kinase n=1 Tax=unclassified Nocardioides TaxID=2615069 RepID=UPI0009F02679|nr:MULTISPECIES: HAMP domain-containing sensor histidine kinase [unclassified Nocardioides]GAW51872.1 ATP-binding region, ATPase domain protein (Precu rsor) [Nocardioides sp. PD653-B2]GAW53474.1 ATP-binding region, ATPase domain protein (Precu rsor) [Nocardioides sp. PD653]